ncbi:hypothetical protein Glove_326g79 [Diversispora epigaea]|uniref:SigF-like NTF2-like domain-containing protein n=1 Tax=Diversispora epigaea TaxID=1348612 RepID=A0A397HU98_9GLOM|nr:hypothetical protein Glove_326g79 [Diversispora epigaea]
MDNPLEEIYQLFNNILVNPDKSLIEKEFNRCFAPDLEFKHFLAFIPPKKGSRESVIRVFRFYRGCYLSNNLVIHDKWFDENTGRMVLSVTQYPKFWIFPWTTIPIKLVAILDIKKNGEKYFISKHEDFFQPEEIIGPFFPHVGPWMVNKLKKFSVGFSILFSYAFEMIGWS